MKFDDMKGAIDTQGLKPIESRIGGFIESKGLTEAEIVEDLAENALRTYRHTPTGGLFMLSRKELRTMSDSSYYQEVK